MTVLIVEDDPVCILILQRFLKGLALKTIVAQSFKEGIAALLADQSIDLIFLDLLLPDKGGIEFLREKKKITEYMYTPVVVTSGKADVPSIAEAIREGANSYLIKPFQPDLFLKTVRMFFDVST